MTYDPNARKLTISYPGGAIAAPKATLVAMFGPTLVASELGEAKTVNREAHQRFVEIGGPPTSVRAANYTKKRYGTRSEAGGAGGEEILVMIGGEDWTARLSGSHQAFCDFLKGASWQSSWEGRWRSKKNSKYGPFRGDEVTP